ncbi:MAG: hypothetical protein JSS79_04075 [Bacteroidetes bacterium]|nr:hypothetical protein [Bacteroidota bacterium]
MKKISQNNIISKIKRDPDQALGYIHNLDMPYKRIENCEPKLFDLLKETISKVRTVDNYLILHCVSVSPDKFLVFTEITYTDFDVNAFGKATDQKNKNYHDFLFEYQPEKKDLYIYSNMYGNSTDKFQKESFIKSVLRVQNVA